MAAGGGRGYRGPGVYFDFIGEAWEMIKKNMAVYVVGTLIVMVITQIVQYPFSMITNKLLYGNAMGNARFGQGFEINWGMAPVAIMISLIPFAISQVLTIGITLCALEEADTGKADLNTLFSGFRNFIPTAITCLLYQIACVLGFLACVVPVFYVAGAFAFAPLIAAKESLGPIEAMQKSYRMLKSNAWEYFGFMFVAGLVNFIGILACCVGLLWTVPILHIGLALHYREFRGPINQGFVAPTMTP